MAIYFFHPSYFPPVPRLCFSKGKGENDSLSLLHSPFLVMFLSEIFTICLIYARGFLFWRKLNGLSQRLEKGDSWWASPGEWSLGYEPDCIPCQSPLENMNQSQIIKDSFTCMGIDIYSVLIGLSLLSIQTNSCRVELIEIRGRWLHAYALMTNLHLVAYRSHNWLSWDLIILSLRAFCSAFLSRPIFLNVYQTSLRWI